MEREEFKILVKALKATYSDPKFIADIDAFDVWYVMLKDIPYEVCQMAIQKYILTRPYNPTIADIRELATEIMTPETPNEGAAWSLVFKAISNSSYHAEEEFNKLPKECQKAVGSPRMLREWAMMEIDQVNSVIQSNFMRSYRVECKRSKELEALPEAMREQVKALSEKMSAKLLESSDL